MRARTLAGLLLELVLGCVVVGAAVELADHARGARLELGRVRLAALTPDTETFLAGLEDRVFLTYYVSPREEMPSHLRRLERDVTDLLDAMKAAAGGLLDYQVVDPTTDPELAAYAARRKVAPVRVRHVTRDAYSEQEIWSTLTMSYGPAPPAMIQGLTDEHLPRLQGLVVEQLRALVAPRAPVFAVAAGPGFEGFTEWLGARGEVRRVDLASDAPLPRDADVVFLLDPAPVDAARLDELDALLDAGRCVVVAGGRRTGRIADVDGLLSVIVERTPYRGDALWNHFGVRVFGGLVFDERCQVLGDPGVAAPFRVTCIANNQDFHSMAFEPNGNLVFEFPTPFLPDGEALAAGGWRAEVLGTSSELTWVQESDAPSIPFALLRPDAGLPSPKQPLAIRLRPEDPWRGSLVGLASASPFRDDLFGAAGTAHERLAQVLLATLAAPDRLVLAGAELARPEPLPALPPGERAAWRLLCIGLVPALLLAAAALRGRAAPPVRRAAGAGWWRPVVARGLVGAAVLGAATALVGGRLDLTESRRHELHSRTRELAALAAADAPVVVEAYVSEAARLPPELRRPTDRLLTMLRELGRDGDLELRVVRPEDLDDAARDALATAGVEPLRVTSTRDEVTEVRTAWSALRLVAGEREVVLAFPDPPSHEAAEFRVALALQNLHTGRAPHVAFASDTPRLSAAERHRYYQEQGLIPPQGKDEYSQARALLEQAGFRVSHVDPERGRLPDDLDALVWLQPRRPMERMIEATAGLLYRGGRVLLAAQHFVIQPQQFRGANFDFVYWPRPQNPDLETYYLPETGLELVREVLLDRESLAVDLESQVNATERRDFRTMRTALPFLVRAAASRFDRESPVTAALGDQAFLAASFLDWDEERVAELGLEVDVLMTTSPDAWTYAWTGGFLPEDVLAGPPAEDDGASRRGPLPLAVDVTGTFPWPTRAFSRTPGQELGPYGVTEPTDERAPGRLVLLACSELFKDERLATLAPEFRGDHLLLDATASLALDEELASVLRRRPVARGFGRLPEESRMRWRATVVLGAPAAYLLLGLFRAFARRRAAA